MVQTVGKISYKEARWVLFAGMETACVIRGYPKHRENQTKSSEVQEIATPFQYITNSKDRLGLK